MENLSTYQANALRTEAPLPTVQDRLEHAALGFTTEIGEIATCVKRIAIYGESLDSLDKDGVSLRDHIGEEIGDVMWYLAIAGDALGCDFFPAISIENQIFDLKDLTLALARVNGSILEGINGCGLSAPEGWILALVEDLRRMWDLLVNLAGVVGLNIDEIAGDNVAKLCERFPDKFTAAAAEARADKGGLDARNS